VVYLFDLFLTPSKNDIFIEREMEKKFSIGMNNLVKIKIGNKSKHYANIFLKDEKLSNFDIDKEEFNVKLNPFDAKEIEYYLIPNKRGEFYLNYLYIKIEGNLNLCKRYFKYKLIDTFEVYPNIKDLSKINLVTLKKSSLTDKMKNRKIYGNGSEFESLRDYLIGDNYKNINWSASARLNKLIVNNLEPERNQQVYILIDSSRVMNTKVNSIKKLDHAINSAVLLSKFVIENGDNIGVAVFDSSVNVYIKAQKGKKHFTNILNKLYNVKGKLVSADYVNVFSYINNRESKKSIVFIFTEHFNLEDSKRLISGMKVFMRKFTPVVISIKDTRVDNLINKYVLKDNDLYLKAASIKLNKEREKSKKIIKNMGIKCLDIEPDKLSMDLINSYLQMKLENT
jgi:uncharacterized protein (DUF58 family)